MWFVFSFVRLLGIWCINCVPEVTLDPAYFNLGTRPIYLATSPLVPQFQLPQATLPHTSMRDAILVWFQRQLSKRNVLMESTILFHRHVHDFSPCSVILILKDTIRSPCSNFSLHRGCLHSSVSKCCKSTPHPTTPLVPQFQLPQATLPHTSMRDAILVWFQRQLSKRNVLMESTILFHRHVHVFSPCSVILILKDTIRSPCSNFSLHRGCLHSSVSKCCKSTPHPTTPLVPQFQTPQATLPHTSMRDAILVWFQRQLSKRNVLMESTNFVSSSCSWFFSMFRHLDLERHHP